MSEHGANPGNLLVATFGALLVATLLLVTVVLPAEYGIDPLGSGKALGLLGLANPEGTALSESTDAVYVRHQVSFDLAPFESVEFKYRLGRGAGMVYSWLASGPLTVDFHAEPDDAPDGFAESFRRGRFHSGNGTYTASFSGIHGWFWENRSMNVVRLDLRSAGFFSQTVKFRDGARVDASLPSPQ